MRNSRKEELARLIHYAKGMGAKVLFRKRPRGYKSVAEWCLDGSEITLYRDSRTSLLDLVLSLIHELGHHKDFINNGRKLDRLVDKALDRSAKKYRKILLKSEIRGTQYWEQIYKDTNCGFGIQVLFKHRDLDLWMYEHFLDTGTDPSKEMYKNKHKELQEKYGC